MPSSRGKSRAKSQVQTPEVEAGAGGGEPTNEVRLPGTTGRYLVLLREDAIEIGTRALTDVAGLEVARAADFANGAVDSATVGGAEAIVFENLGVAVVDTPPSQLRSLGAMGEDSGILAIEPERMNYVIDESPRVDVLPSQPTGGGGGQLSVEYLLGYREAVNHLVERLLGGAGAGAAALAEAGAPTTNLVDDQQFTWGLRATRVSESRYSGKGIRVAVLDTGFDLQHPDFLGRSVTTRSFIPGEDVQDGHGHGTHCIGTSCGPKTPGQGPRYGIAYEAEIYAGKVLSNAGSGGDAGILAGISWAISNKCRVISMSLGAPTTIGQGYSRVYETVARRALAAGTLIIAAAGNESQRPGLVAPVGHPANCPSIMAVAALDGQGAIARFSCGGRELQGGQVDIAGPGVGVRSSWPRPMLYRSISGTSMATPHVAGIAALHAEANSDVQGGALGWLLLQSALRLSLPVNDVGAGLVQAP
jgi:subtilisin